MATGIASRHFSIGNRPTLIGLGGRQGSAAQIAKKTNKKLTKKTSRGVESMRVWERGQTPKTAAGFLSCFFFRF